MYMCVCEKETERQAESETDQERKPILQAVKNWSINAKAIILLLTEHLSIIASEDQSEDSGHNIYFSTPKDWEP